MKVLAVKLKNIHTLVGEWEIRFDRPPLSDTGLFAIVGPNGSGKSSILDAITLGLYGETARHRSLEGGVTSFPVDDASSEVTFSVGDDLYRTRWSVRKSAGVWEAPEMSLVGVTNGDETLLEDRLIRVRGRMAELTGLDFKRFCRSVLLAQGEFSAFLGALENERAEILDKIIGSELASELEEAVEDRARQEQEKLFQLKEAAAAFPVPDKERMNELRFSAEQKEEEYREVRSSLEALQQTRTRILQRENLETQSLEVAASLAEAEARWADARREAQKLEEAWPASPLRGQVEHLDSLGAAKDAAQERLLQLELDLQEREARFEELDTNLRMNRAEWEEARARMEGRSTEIMDAAASDREIESQSQRFLDMVSRYEAVDRELKGLLQSGPQVQERLDQIEHRRGEILGWLERHKKEDSLVGDQAVLEEEIKRLDEIADQISQYRAQRVEAQKLEAESSKELDRAQKALDKARRKAEHLMERRSEREGRLDELLDHLGFESLNAAVLDHRKKLAVCKELLEISRRAQSLTLVADAPMELARIEAEQLSVSRALDDEKRAYDALQDQIRYRELVRKLDVDRPSLVHGTPCPLCGALDHPYVEQSPPDFSELERIAGERTAGIDALQEQLASLQTEAESIQVQIEEMEALRGRWERICVEAGLEWAITDGETIQDRVQAMEGDIDRWTSNLRRAKWLKWRISWSDGALRRRSARLQQREREYQTVEKRHTERREAVLEIDGHIERLKADDESIRLEIGIRVQPYGETSPDAGAEKELMRRLTERREELVRRRRELETLGEELQSLQKQMMSMPTEQERLQEEARILAADAESLQGSLTDLKSRRESQYGDLDPLREQQALEEHLGRLTQEETALSDESEMLRIAIEEGRAELPRCSEDAAHLQSAYEEAEARFLEEMKTAGFSELMGLKMQLAVLDDSQVILERVASAEKELAKAKANADEIQVALEVLSMEQAPGEPVEAIEAIEAQVDEIEKRCELLRREKEDAELTLRHARDEERERREIQAAIAVQEKVYEETLAEQKLIRMRDAAETRRKRQRLMLSMLIEQTNEHLALLSGRYLLRASGEEGLGIEVEDAQQGRARRPVKSLSGGESFVVSLCLALGLSGIAAKHRKIESLFLDEGFGTLDDEMLYRVLAALRELRANGKVVGVISHVKRLADEISTQIRLDRAPDGSSRITIVA